MTKKGEFSDYHYKIVLVGDSGVGKSNIISRFTKNQFNLESKTTIGVEFATKTIIVDDKTVKVQIWDTAGQQRYRSMASAYYRGANGALLVYDITRSTSFENLEKWIKELKNFGSEDIVCLMIGNKSDLKQYRSMKFEHGEQYAKNNNMGFFQTSAMDGSNIDEAFKLMVSCNCFFMGRNVEKIKICTQKIVKHPCIQEVKSSNTKHQTYQKELLQLIVLKHEKSSKIKN